MQDKTINNALQQLYREAINGQHEGKEHILALMKLRGIEPAAEKRSQHRVFPGRSGMRQFVLAAMRDGHTDFKVIASLLHQQHPEIGAHGAYMRVYGCMRRMGVILPRRNASQGIIGINGESAHI
ncbi:hypothetical protein FHY55_17045 [Oceanicola sp. D3]|uniref:hypothetical protein n=1 Tax=Oceanicola sp. D3 TaxID=2587163 RepID=UPI00112477FF|nr:hypothetical protein [Oceanicola sp. D3]QDC10836.1 hypothetical protein FHY55_17045 [Oceanicola sp. D3]